MLHPVYIYVLTCSTARSDPPKEPEAMSGVEYTGKPSDHDEGEVWIEYHPASAVTLPTVLFDEHIPPWHPFCSRADFEQAELFLRADCTDSFIDAQLKLIHAGSPLGHSITLKSAKEMHKILAQIPTIEDLPDVSVVPRIIYCTQC